jgi:hypothetical protein
MFNKIVITLGETLFLGQAQAATVIKVGHGANNKYHMHRALLHFEKLSYF